VRLQKIPDIALMRVAAYRGSAAICGAVHICNTDKASLPCAVVRRRTDEGPPARCYQEVSRQVPKVEVMLKIGPGNLSNFTDGEIEAIYDYLVARWTGLTANQNAPAASKSFQLSRWVRRMRSAACREDPDV
jgi:hypothetical protein